MNKDTSPKQTYSKSVLKFVILAAIVFTISTVVIYKAFVDFSEFRELSSHESEVLETLEQNRANIEELEREAHRLDDEGLSKEDVLALLPIRYQPAADLAMIEQLVEGSGVRLIDASVTPGESIGEFSPPPVDEDQEPGQEQQVVSSEPVPYTATISVTGSYSGIKQFLTRIEESRQPQITSQLTITSEGSDIILAEITLTLYHQPGGNIQPQEEFIQ